MADQGAMYTDKELEKMEKKIREVYEEAEKDMQKKFDEFCRKFDVKHAIYKEKLDNGEITQDQYSAWMRGQMFQSRQWTAKKQQIIDTIYNANVEATKIINGGTVSVFAENANWSHYQMEHGEGINFGFGLYDANAVTNLIKNDPQVLPKWKVNEKKDYKWNSKKVDNAITQGIIQGEGLGDIATRLATALSSNNQNTMLTFARTAMTGAQNAGRNQGLMDAKDLGIEVVKEWVATLDDHTRTSHRYLDGEKQKVGDKWHPFKFSNGCRYPGDPQGPPHEVYNCRCTLVGDIEKYPDEFKRYDNIAGQPIKGMTYKQWKATKTTAVTPPTIPKPAVLPKPTTQEPPAIDYSEYGGEEAFNVLAKYGDVEDFTDNASYDEMEILEKAGFDLYTFNGEDKLEEMINKAHDAVYQSLKAPGDGTTNLTLDTTLDWLRACRHNPSIGEMLRREKKIFENMSEEEKRALVAYTGSAYRSMNGYLRRVGAGMTSKESLGYTDKRTVERIKLCHDALNNNRLEQDMVLRRGTDLGDLAGLFMTGDFDDNVDLLGNKTVEELNAMFQGQVGTYFGFTSTSSQWDRGFTGEVEVVINAPKGTAAASIMTISQFGTGEGETLLRDNTKVICEKIEASDGHKYSSIRVFLTIIVD